jgi:hypothetical protein
MHASGAHPLFELRASNVDLDEIQNGLSYHCYFKYSPSAALDIGAAAY